jgi:hypothetical protein
MLSARAKAPRAVGRYQLVHEVGQSYLGPLWVVRVDGSDGAVQHGLLRLVSLANLTADMRVRLLEAAWQAMEVRDEHVSSVTDVVASDGELGIVSDYVEGVTLRTLSSLGSVRRKPMPVGVALRIAVDLLAAVGALHRTAAELGDEAVPLFGGITTDGVLVSADGRTVITDVAVSSAASTIEQFAQSPERVAYATPEELGSTPHADARTDVFAVGILLWELLTSRRLFIGSDKTLVQKVVAAKIPSLKDSRKKGDPELPDAVTLAVMKALGRAPEQRFATPNAFAEALAMAPDAIGTTEDVAAYLAEVAEGALARVRDALRPRDASPAVEVMTSAKSSSALAAAVVPPVTRVSAPSAPLTTTGVTPASASRTTTATRTNPAIKKPLLPRTTGAIPVPRVAQRMTLHGGWAPPPATAEALAAARAEGQPPASPTLTSLVAAPTVSVGATEARVNATAAPHVSTNMATSVPDRGQTARTDDDVAGVRQPKKPMVRVRSSKVRPGAAAGGEKSGFRPSLPPSSPLMGRARQATMIGIPMPASPSSPELEPAFQGNDELTQDYAAPPPSSHRSGVVATPPAPSDEAEVLPTEALQKRGPSRSSLDVEDEEPTHQWSSKELLQQVEAMVRKPEETPSRKRGFVEPPTVPQSEPYLDPGSNFDNPLPAPPGAPIEDGGWLDEPEPIATVESILGERQGEGRSPSMSDSTPAPASFSPDANELIESRDATTSRLKATTSRDIAFPVSPSMSTPSLIPSQVSPPLIHDPRANRPQTGRVARASTARVSPVPAPKSGAKRWLSIAALSLAVICASGGVSVLVLRSRAGAKTEVAPVATTSRTSAVLASPTTPLPAPTPSATAPPSASAAAAAEEPSAAPSGSPTEGPSATASAEPAAAASAEPAPTASAESAASASAEPAAAAPSASATSTTPVATVKPTAVAKAARAPAPPAPTKRAPQKKKSKYVPDDI